MNSDYRFHLGEENESPDKWDFECSASLHYLYAFWGARNVNFNSWKTHSTEGQGLGPGLGPPTRASPGNAEQLPYCQLRGRVTERICRVRIEPAPCWEELPAPGHLVINIAN